MNTDQQLLFAKLNSYNTNHILHFLLTLFTLGLWIPVWILCGFSNSVERKKIETQIRRADVKGFRFS